MIRWVPPDIVTFVFSVHALVVKIFLPSSHNENETNGDEEFAPATMFVGEFTVALLEGVQIVTEGSVALCGHGGTGMRKNPADSGNNHSESHSGLSLDNRLRSR